MHEILTFECKWLKEIVFWGHETQYRILKAGLMFSQFTLKFKSQSTQINEKYYQPLHVIAA